MLRSEESLVDGVDDSAERGQILINEETFRAAGEHFHVIRLGDRVLPKQQRTVPLFEVTGEDDQPDRD